MLPSISVFALLPLLLVQVQAAVVPARRVVADRDISFESVRNAVVAFAQPSLDPISDPISAFDTDSAPIPTPFFAAVQPTSTQTQENVANAQVFAAEQGEQGHWVVYTTSSWLAAADPTPTQDTTAPPVSSDAPSPSGGLPSGSYGQQIPPNQDQPQASTNPAYQPINSVVSSLLPSSLIPSLLPTTPSTLDPSPFPTSAPAFPTASPQPAPPTGGGNYMPGKHVFAHFMVGIVSTYHQQDWVNDMQLAKQKGITGFALNIGVDPYTQDQLDLAYAAAETVGDFQMFISFDFNWYKPDDTNGVATMMKRYVDKPAQLLVDGKPFVSSFIGDGFNWKACADLVGREIYPVPFFQPTSEHANDPGVSGLFSWAAWPGQLDNQPLKANMTLNRDEAYLDVLDPAGKQYMAPVSPWFFTHFGPEVSYSKNWLFYSESLWKTRWDQILELGARGVNFVEIVTWNDYGEAHHVGPYNTPHTNDGASKWAEGLDHSAMLEFAVPYIEAFKQGKREPVINKEMLVYWHRPHLKDVNCDATDNCGSKPKGWEYVDDVLFVTTMTSNGGTVIVNSGSGTAFIQSVEAGVQTFEVPMQVGEQRFQLLTNAGLSAGGSSNVTVTDSCWNGIYNFNFHSGIIA